MWCTTSDRIAPSCPGYMPAMERAGTARGLRLAGQLALGAALAFAGTSHLSFARDEFRAQVPPWMPHDDDLVVLASGVVEIGLGAALLVTRLSLVGRWSA